MVNKREKIWDAFPLTSARPLQSGRVPKELLDRTYFRKRGALDACHFRPVESCPSRCQIKLLPPFFPFFYPWPRLPEASLDLHLWVKGWEVGGLRGPWWITAPRSTPRRRKLEELRLISSRRRTGLNRRRLSTLFRPRPPLSQGCDWPLRLGSLAPLESDWGHCPPPLSPGEVPLRLLPPDILLLELQLEAGCVSSRWWQGWYLQ